MTHSVCICQKKRVKQNVCTIRFQWIYRICKPVSISVLFGRQIRICKLKCANGNFEYKSSFILFPEHDLLMCDLFFFSFFLFWFVGRQSWLYTASHSRWKWKLGFSNIFNWKQQILEYWGTELSSGHRISTGLWTGTLRHDKDATTAWLWCDITTG